ncbi:hypothetical protein AKG39_12480 [Acetobacterium bakii]|uniref:Uncharacterized protein n=1 Tax=Acetobacterium bakii TaxID=52689 RepID=A0A0L6TYT8_9FIRM|nr:hypothetical protein AKG39_12480 [Acetobacterium bakii]
MTKQKVSSGDNRNISCVHQGEQAAAGTILQHTTIYRCSQDRVVYKLTEAARSLEKKAKSKSWGQS